LPDSDVRGLDAKPQCVVERLVEQGQGRAIEFLDDGSHFSSARARSVITVSSLVAMIAAQLLTGPRAIRTLVMCLLLPRPFPSVPSLSAHTLAEPTSGIPGCRHAQRRRITGYRRNRNGS